MTDKPGTGELSGAAPFEWPGKQQCEEICANCHVRLGDHAAGTLACPPRTTVFRKEVSEGAAQPATPHKAQAFRDWRNEHPEVPGKAGMQDGFYAGWECRTALWAGANSPAPEAPPATPHEEKLLLLRTIVELSYCHSAETVSLVESAEGRAIIEAGMKLLDMEDLSEESQAEAKRKIMAGSTPKSS